MFFNRRKIRRLENDIENLETQIKWLKDEKWRLWDEIHLIHKFLGVKVEHVMEHKKLVENKFKVGEG